MKATDNNDYIRDLLKCGTGQTIFAVPRLVDGKPTLMRVGDGRRSIFYDAANGRAGIVDDRGAHLVVVEGEVSKEADAILLMFTWDEETDLLEMIANQQIHKDRNIVHLIKTGGITWKLPTDFSIDS